MTRKQLLEQYDDLYDTLLQDKDLMLRVLLHHFGGVDHLWCIVHEHFTSLHDEKNLDDDELEDEVNAVVEAYREVVDQIAEEELLDD